MDGLNNLDATSYVVNLGIKVLHLGDNLKSQLIRNDQMPSKDVNAIFVKEDWTIYFNQEWVDKAQLLEVLHIGFRQVRHAYQTMQVMYNDKGLSPFYKEPLDRVDLWKEELNNKNTLDTFLTLEINIDAYAFANYMMKKLFDTHFNIPKEIESKVNTRIKEIDKVLKLEQISLDK